MPDYEDLTELQKDELDAMVGDRAAALRVVSGLRRYRALVEGLVNGWGLDAPARARTESDVRSIEGGE